MEELNCETVFTLPIVGGISESVVVTWIIMAVLVLASIILVRNLKVENPGKVQLALEAGIGWAEDFFEGILGKENKGYIPYLITVLLYLACSNTLAPLFGFKPPTKDLNVTAALAIMSMCLIEFSGIKKNGMKHWVKHFAEPIPDRSTDYDFGDRHPAIVALYAIIWKYAGRICGNGASESCSSTDCTDSGQFLFRYFRWPSSGVRICIPDIFIHDGRDGVNVIRLEYQTGKIRIT